MEVFSCTMYQVIASFDYSGDILKCCIGFGGGGGILEFNYIVKCQNGGIFMYNLSGYCIL